MEESRLCGDPVLWLEGVQREEIETKVVLAMDERQDHAMPVGAPETK